MPGKGVYKIHDGDEWRSYGNDRIEEIEKELAESEVILAEVPGLRETYFQ